ncbi:unnamed protein product [Coccothraustes coccothraustes]
MKLVTQTERTPPRPAGGRPGPLIPSLGGRSAPSEAGARAGPSASGPRGQRVSARPARQAHFRASSARRLRLSARAAGGVASLVPTPQPRYKAGARAARPLFPRGAPAVAAHGVMERWFSVVPSTLYIKNLMEGPSQAEEYLLQTSGFS